MNYRLLYRDELYHHGVKGMKWDVRKERETGGLSHRKTEKKPQSVSKDYA